MGNNGSNNDNFSNQTTTASNAKHNKIKTPKNSPNYNDVFLSPSLPNLDDHLSFSMTLTPVTSNGPRSHTMTLTPNGFPSNSMTLTPMTSNGASSSTNSQTPMKLLPLSLSSFPSTSNLSLLSTSSSTSYRSKLIKRTVSDGAAELATYFWQNNVEPLSMKHRLEIACSIWFGMLLDVDVEDFAITQFSTREEVETTALKILDMLAFIVRSVYRSSPDLPSALQKLGELHIKIGVDIKQYRVMLHHIHRTFRRFCTLEYTETMEFAMSEVFTYCVQLMTGHDLKTQEVKDLSFLKTLRGCIQDPVGSEYLFKYLNNVYCDEMVVFLYLLSTFKSTQNNTKRQIIAEQIAKHCIDDSGSFALNISYDYRFKILKDIAAMGKIDENVDVDVNFFVDVEDQICRLIQQSHWKKFKMYMKEMYFIQ